MRRAAWRRLAMVPAAAAAAMLYFLHDPASAGFFPKCPFLLLSGWKCPGCGSQRALHALLHGRLGEAFACNALLVLSLPLVLSLLAAEAIRTRRPACYAALHRPLLIRSILAAVLLWWLLRNLYGW